MRFDFSHPSKMTPEEKQQTEDLVNKWIKDANNNGNKIESRGSSNFSSDEAKEIARLRKELKDTQDALEVLKKAIGILGK